MSGPQFVHLQSFSRKANPRGQSVDQVLSEAERAAEFSTHVKQPKPPSVVSGVDVAELRRLHDEMVAAGGVEVTLKDGRTARRGIRKDRHTLMTAVASHPLPTDLVLSDSDARTEYDRWRDHNLAWLKARFGDKLVSVIEHWDEKHPHIHAYILPLDDPTCSARQLNPAWQAKEEAMEALRASGHDDKAALKLGNAAYRSKARELQGDYYEQVSLPCGLTRTGPKRRRLSRQQWKAEKDAAKRDAQRAKDMISRVDKIAKAQVQLEASVSDQAKEIAVKLDQANRVLGEAEEERSEARRLRQQVEKDVNAARDNAEREVAAHKRELSSAHERVLEEARQQLAEETRQHQVAAKNLESERRQLAGDRDRQLQEVAQDTGRLVLRLVVGVVDGTVRRNQEKTGWVIQDADLREKVVQSGLFEMMKEALTRLHETWSALRQHLTEAEKKTVSESIIKPLRSALPPQNEGPGR